MYSIEVNDISKKFRLYHDKSVTLKERLLFFNRTRYEEHEVLKDISLNIEKGKTIGLIGQNGSGKSTLLKLLTKIIYPDKGEIIMNGKVSSLLELGAGFHPDFSGRENIYTNASIFGLSRKEIDERFEKIVEFSELHEFIDNPVRTYSSGMYTRLAFSVAINVDADILLVDEILAVGDASFQKKCMDKIKELKNNGTTIVIVTHDMGAVERICDEAVWLEGGRIKEKGNSFNVVNSYMEFMGKKQENQIRKIEENKEKNNLQNNDASMNKSDLIKREQEQNEPDKNEDKKRWGNKDIILSNLRITDQQGKEKTGFKCGEKAAIIFNYSMKNKLLKNPVFGLSIFRNDGVCVYGSNTQIEKAKDIYLKNDGQVKYVINNLNLIQGHYYLDIAVVSEEGFPYDYIKSIAELDVYSDINDIGIIRINHEWYIDEKLISKL